MNTERQTRSLGIQLIIYSTIVPYDHHLKSEVSIIYLLMFYSTSAEGL